MVTSPSAIAALVRWPNAIMAGAGVAVGAWWAGARVEERPVLAAIVAALALAAFANTVNDMHDVEIDRIAHPRRPLPSGTLTHQTAAWVAVAAAAIATAASLSAQPMLAALTVLVLLAMFIYSRTVKRLGLPGNILVAVIASLPFLYGGWAARNPVPTLALVALAVPLHLAREIAKDLDDASADAASRRTLPVVHGLHTARVALLLALLAFCAMLVPWVLRSPRFAILVGPALLLCALGAHRAMVGKPGSPDRLKLAMIFAMASLVALRAL